MTTLQTEMGRRLRLTRKALGLTQEDFSETAHVGLTTISAWETGRNTIDILALARLTARHGFSADYIILGNPGGMRHDLVTRIEQIQSTSNRKTSQ